jgi:hypothetical protein
MRSAGCVINDYADRKIDKLIERTQNRPITTGEIHPKSALILFFPLYPPWHTWYRKQPSKQPLLEKPTTHHLAHCHSSQQMRKIDKLIDASEWCL